MTSCGREVSVLCDVVEAVCVLATLCRGRSDSSGLWSGQGSGLCTFCSFAVLGLFIVFCCGAANFLVETCLKLGLVGEGRIFSLADVRLLEKCNSFLKNCLKLRVSKECWLLNVGTVSWTPHKSPSSPKGNLLDSPVKVIQYSVYLLP